MMTIVPEGQSHPGATTDRSHHGLSPENSPSPARRGHIGLVVAGSIIAGLVAALVLVLGSFTGAQEDVISGTILLAFASGWALLAVLSLRTMRVVLADGQAKVRSALRLLLTHELHMEVVGEADDLPGVRAHIDVACPDLLLVDWRLFDGQPAATLLTLRFLCPHLLVFALSGYAEERRPALEAGMDGFVSKVDSATQGVTTLRGLGSIETIRKDLSHER